MAGFVDHVQYECDLGWHTIRVKEIFDPPQASQISTIFGNEAGHVGAKKASVATAAQNFYKAAQQTLV